MNFFFPKKTSRGDSQRTASHKQVKSLGDGIWKVGKDRWEISSRYDVEEPIGSGAYGSVVRAKDKVTKRLVAIKRIEGAALSNSTDALRILREVSILSRIKHRWALHLLFLQPSHICFPTPRRFLRHCLVIDPMLQAHNRTPAPYNQERGVAALGAAASRQHASSLRCF